MRKAFLVALVTLGLGLLSGCGTILSTSAGELTPFSGARLDAWVMNSRMSTAGDTALAVMDFPFSLAGDGLLLPITVAAQIERLTEPGQYPDL